DLLDRGGVVALLPDQPERVVPDGGAGLGFLALAQPKPGARTVPTVLAVGPRAGVTRPGARLFRQCAHALILPLPQAAGTQRARAAVRGKGRKARARMTPTTASPALTHSCASIPCTKADRTMCASDADPSLPATASPANTLLRTASAVAAGRFARCSWDW